MASKALIKTEAMFSEFFEILQANKWDTSKILIPRQEWRVNFSSNTKKEN